MSGFSGIQIFDDKLAGKLQCFSFPESLDQYYQKWQQFEAPDFRIYCYNNGKFVKDSVLIHHSNMLLGFDGINLTNVGLDKIDGEKSFLRTVGSIRGSFSSVYRDEGAKQVVLLADHTGSRQLFYFGNSSFFAFSSSIFLLSRILRHFGIGLTISYPASYMILSLGYLLEDYTLINEIKKVKAGHFVRANQSGANLEKYHDYYREIKYNRITLDLLHELNTRFVRSVKLEYEKDLQYGYSHLSTLSGGLDSRLNVMVAYKSGYKDITCLTFSEGFRSDELTPRKISYDLSLKHVLLLLNNGFQLYDIQTPLILNNCAVYYYGAAHTLAAVRRLNFSNYGLIHNGSLAESSKGSYLSGKKHRVSGLANHFRISGKLFDRLETPLLVNIFQRYANDEMCATYNRGFNSTHNGSWMTMPFTDSVCTYMDLDFADLAYSIHPSLRFGGYLTVDWIKKLNPEAGNYNWLRGVKPTNNVLKMLPARILYRIKLTLTQKADEATPLEEWYKNSITLREFVRQEFRRSHSFDVLPNELRQDINELFLNGTVKEKLLSISYLKSIELLFCN